ncbi:hypothetical protein MOSE0_C00188 [Monosporozyma servazzii]
MVSLVSYYLRSLKLCLFLRIVSTGEGARTETISLLVHVKKTDQRNGNSLLSLLAGSDISIYASLHGCYVSL